MQKIFKLFVLGLLLTFIAACVSEPEYPDEPAISYVSVSKTAVNEFDSLTLTFGFTDGDGDLGKERTSNSNCTDFCSFEGDTACFQDPYFACFFIDMRDSCYGALTLPDLEPDGNTKAISGEIDIVIPPVFCKCGGNPCPPTQDVVYQIIISDFAGNFSNTILSEPITITCN